MSKILKKRVIAERLAAYKGHTQFILISYKGLKANQAVELRHQLHTQKLKMNVVKNAILKRALEQLNLSALGAHVKEMSAIVYGGDDPVILAKCLYGYKSKNQTLEIRAGLVDGKLLTPDDVKALSALPGRQQLLAQMVGTLAAPTTRLVRDLNGIIAKLLYALKAVEDKQSASEKK